MAKEKITEIVKNVLPAVVTITISKYLTIYKRQPLGLPFSGFEEFFFIPKRRKKVKIGGGSGFIVDKNGLILTNRHVVADPEAEYVVILNDERKFKARILARDPINDVAVLKIDAKNLPIVKLGDSSKLELGQKAIAIGNVLGAFRNTVSVGVISGLSREITAGDLLSKTKTRLRGLIQTDAAVNPGNSGGPLLNIEGKVIGINVAVVFLAENIGFALPIKTAKKALKEVKRYGRIRRPFLGVRYIPITKALKERYNLPVDSGALIIPEPYPGGEAVVKNSPAEKAGIRKVDIILQVGKEKISLKNPLEESLQKFKVGSEISIKILREGKEMKLKVKLGERK